MGSKITKIKTQILKKMEDFTIGSMRSLRSQKRKEKHSMKNRIAKTVSIVLALVMLLTIISGCAPVGVSQEEYDEAVAERDTAKAKVTELGSDLAAAQAQVASLGKEIAAAKAEKPTPIPPTPTPVPPTPTPAPTPTPEITTITDSAGREIELPSSLERVVVLNPPNAEVMRALGVADRVIGISGSLAKPDYWPALAQKPVVAKHAHGEPDFEKIIELDPQIVLTYGTHRAVDVTAMADTLAPAGIEVVGIDCYKLDTLFADIEILGEMFGKEEAAAELIGFLQIIPQMAESKVKDLKPEERVTVYAESHGGDYVAFGPGSEWHTMIETAGGSNIFADAAKPYTEVDPEVLIERNPQVILKDARRTPKMGYGVTDTEPMQAYLDEFTARPGWSEIDAVRDGKVYVVSSALGAGPTKMITILYFAKVLYPERFADIDPDSVLAKYYEKFQGVEFKGMFMYPEP